jgi:hypothetical protein
MLLLSFGLANGQPSSAISLSAVAGTYGTDGPDGNSFPDTVRTGVNIVFTIRYHNSGTTQMLGGTNGWVVYSPDVIPAVWDSTKLDTLALTGATWLARSDQAFAFYPIDTPNFDDMTFEGTDSNGFVANGAAPDTVGLSLSSNSAPHWEVGFNQNAISITLKAINAIHSGKSVCLDSSVYSPAANAWLWAHTSGGSSIPSWDGPHCFTIFQVPNECPTFSNCPTSLTFNHCAPATYDFNATDPEGDAPLTFSKVSGPGTVNAASGVWNYAPTLADVGTSQTLVVGVTDGLCGGTTNCSVSLNFTNVCPTMTDGCGALVAVGKGNSADADVDASSGDCDPITYSLGTPSPVPVGTYSINSSTGTVTFNSDEADGGDTICFPVIVSDGNCADTCEVCFDVLVVEPFAVQIEKTHNTIQGTHEEVCVTLNAGSEQMWGFDFLIAYDNSALSLVAAIEGEIYAECGWEYFTYRFGANGNCSNACPTGLVRVVGLAETNNGANHPDCYLPPNLPTTLFCLDFLVTNDRTFECQYVPVRFFWVDCGDNTISFNPSDDPTGMEQRLAVSRAIFDFDFFAGDISNGSTGFPTFYGAQDVCLEGGGDGKPAPVRFIDFINGGVDIVCADSIDDRGDINLNGLANEVADAVLFTNYFIYGISVFTVNVQGQIAATDINADGLVLSVADLVYLIRIVIGDATPFAKLAPIESVLRNQGGVLSIAELEVGAASIVFEGNAHPTLLAENMELVYAFDAANNVTRTLVSSPIVVGADMQSFTGSFLNTNGAEIVSIEMATAEGAPILAKEVELPTEFALNQNYPNPFNPKTRISFNLPSSSDYTLTIYNVTGQKVTEFTGSHEAGTVELDVDATNYSSGVYFYKLIANNGRFTETKKMVLVK